MSIAGEPFAEHLGFLLYRLPTAERPISVAAAIQCRQCGYEPEQGLSPQVCPRCHCGCWERYVRAERHRMFPRGRDDSTAGPPTGA